MDIKRIEMRGGESYICFDDFFDFYKRYINFFGKFSDSFIRVFISEGVNVDFYFWGVLLEEISRVNILKRI